MTHSEELWVLSPYLDSYHLKAVYLPIRGRSLVASAITYSINVGTDRGDEIGGHSLILRANKITQVDSGPINTILQIREEEKLFGAFDILDLQDDNICLAVN